MNERPGVGRIERFEWLLTTAQIEELPKGSMLFDDLATQAHEVEHKKFGKGLRIDEDQFKDDEFGFASDWASQMGAAMALHPQTQCVELLKNGSARNGYDGVSFFNAAHPVNPATANGATYSNVIGAAALTVDTFVAACARLESFVMPNGESRGLKATHLVVPPALRKVATEITGAKFLAQAGGGTSDNVLLDYNVKPLVIPQIAATTPGGSDTTWYVAGRDRGQLGKPFVYSLRDAFLMSTYEGLTQAQLSRMQELEWHVKGRAVGAYGHPYTIIKNTA